MPLSRLITTSSNNEVHKRFLDATKNWIVKIIKKRKYLKILKVELIDGKKNSYWTQQSLPSEISFQLNYDNKIIGKQKNTINFELDDLNDVYIQNFLLI